MRVCRDLPAGFVGIGSEKSVDVAVRDSNVMTAAEIKDLKVKSDQRIKELYTNPPSPLHRRISGTWQGSMSMVLGKGL